MQPQYQRQIGTCTHMYIGQVGEACAFDLDSLHWQPGLRFLIQFRARFLFDFHFHFRMDSIKRTDGQSSFVASSENLFSFSMRDPLWSLPDA